MPDTARFRDRLSGLIAEIDDAAEDEACLSRAKLLTALCHLQLAADTLAKAPGPPTPPAWRP